MEYLLGLLIGTGVCLVVWLIRNTQRATPPPFPGVTVTVVPLNDTADDPLAPVADTADIPLASVHGSLVIRPDGTTATNITWTNHGSSTARVCPIHRNHLAFMVTHDAHHHINAPTSRDSD